MHTSDFCRILSTLVRLGRILGVKDVQFWFQSQPFQPQLFYLPGPFSLQLRLAASGPDRLRTCRQAQVPLGQLANYLTHLERLPSDVPLRFRTTDQSLTIQWSSGHYTLSLLPPADADLDLIQDPRLDWPDPDWPAMPLARCYWQPLLIPIADRNQMAPVMVMPDYVATWQEQYRALFVQLPQPGLGQPLAQTLLPGPLVSAAAQLPMPAKLYQVQPPGSGYVLLGQLSEAVQYVLTGPAMELQPPNFDRLLKLPLNRTLAVDRPQLIQTLGRVHAIHEPGRFDVTLQHEPGSDQLIVAALGQGPMVREAMDRVACHGDTLTVTLHLEWLLHALQQINTGMVRLRWQYDPQHQPAVRCFGFYEQGFRCVLSTIWARVGPTVADPSDVVDNSHAIQPDPVRAA